jgi:hypothetical protein
LLDQTIYETSLVLDEGIRLVIGNSEGKWFSHATSISKIGTNSIETVDESRLRQLSGQKHAWTVDEFTLVGESPGRIS